MSIEGELARAGIITTDDETVFIKDVEITGDIFVEGGATFSGGTTIDGDLAVRGAITGDVVGKYVLIINIADLSSAATGGYAVIPTDGGGYISHAYSVLQGDVGVSGGTLELNTEAGALVDTYDITIADASSAGDVDATVAIPSTATNNVVAEGEAIWVDVDNACTEAVGCMVVIEITRT